MYSHGRFPRVLNELPREEIESDPRDFLEANPRPHPRPDQRPKTRGPQGFLAFGLAENVTKSSHLENPEWGLQFSSETVLFLLKGPPEGSIHHDTFKAFPQISRILI